MEFLKKIMSNKKSQDKKKELNIKKNINNPFATLKNLSLNN